MLNSIITGTEITLDAFLICTGASLLLGLATAGLCMYKNRYSQGFVITFAMLPAVVELVIMLVLNRKSSGREEWVAPNAGTVDLTPWKYRHIVCAIGILIAVGIYIFFSPIGIAA